MKITKRNGNVVMYDDEKIAKSILKANSQVNEEEISERKASRIANEAFNILTRDRDVITTEEIRSCVFTLLMQDGFTKTAHNYMDYKKNKYRS